jgi:hypothetical protein
MNRFRALVNRDSIRSIWGQLALLGVTYAGAVALAVLALCLRGSFFEYHVRERYPEASPRIRAMIEQAARASEDAGTREPLTGEEREVVYGAWISDPAVDPMGHAALRLLWTDPDEMISRLRITFVVGNLAQRMRALDLLAYGKHDSREKAIALCRFLAERAQRRSEWALADKANHVLGRLEPTS